MLKDIEQALKDFQRGRLALNAENLLNTLGYESEITVDFESNLAEAFIEYFDEFGKLNSERAMVDDWESIDFLFQLTEEEISGSGQIRIAFNNKQLDNTIIESYVFFALKLKESDYTRTQLSNITREINKLMPMPAMIIFQHGQTVTLAVINRRLHKRDEAKDVLEKVTLIKDIESHDPHPAHIKILFDLSRNELFRIHGFSNFVELHRAWEKTLDIQELNKQFYRELSNWYFWAVDTVTFPEDAGENVDIRNATSIIRLITRLIFVWFIKEKKLVPDIFFNPREIEKILVSTDPQESTYYKAILQNLFFATLNQEMNTAEKSDNRKFRGKGRQHYNITSLYRYEEYFANSDEALQQFETIPFLNGGLFECLDKRDKDDPKNILRVDGFSDREDNQLSVPNFLFFSDETEVDLNKVYDTKGKRYKVRGLIEILRRYKFTITENTPIEEEVALDPELLGKVFENLLAAYNPETGATARKQTGSFYTPREIVNYMVDESLIAYLKNALAGRSDLRIETSSGRSDLRIATSSGRSDLRIATSSGRSDLQIATLDIATETKLRTLLAYNDKPHQFTDAETDQLINAIDTLKILDPACGSGAFPMGILHKLVFILGKLDPRNDQWRQRQIAKVQNLISMAEEIDDSTVRRNTLRDLEREIDNINEAFERNELDYGRKLYLIENCIYGVDIQPIAVQIAKLRFFISLVVDQRIDEAQENRGVRPLPNLETKFVAGDTLISVDKPKQQTLRNPEIDTKEKALSEVRRKHFTARTPRTKDKYRELDQQIRDEISELLKRDGFPYETTEKIASWDPYNQNATADWFDSEWMFGLTVGFDVVIANPPYLKEQNNKSVFEPVIKNQWGKQWHQGKMDYWYFFLHKAIDIVSKSGVVSYITSRYWLNSSGAKKLIRRIKDELSFISFVDIGKLKVFDEVVGQHMVAVYVKSKDHDEFIYKKLQNNLIDLNKMENTDNLHIKELKNSTIYSNQDEILVEAEQMHLENVIRLGEICDVSQGVVEAPDRISKKALEKTPVENVQVGDGVFVLTQSEVDCLRLNAEERKVLKKYVNPMNVFRYGVKWDEKYLIYSDKWIKKKIEDDEQFAQLKNHLDKFQRLITSSNGPYGMHRPRQDKYFISAKIIFKNMFKRPEFTYDTSELFFGFSFSSIIEKEKNYDLKYVLAILNSNFALYWYQRNCKKRGAGFDVGVQKIRDFPIAKVRHEQQKPLIVLVDKILDAKHTNPDADTSILENEIDNLVYELYNLTEDEIAIMEESV